MGVEVAVSDALALKRVEWVGKEGERGMEGVPILLPVAPLKIEVVMEGLEKAVCVVVVEADAVAERQ